MTANRPEPGSLDRPPQAPAPAAAPWEHRQVVLVVDDEPDILDAIKDTIEIFLPNVEVVAVPSGADGLGALRAGRVDLIVTDYKMPGMDGLEFLRRARELAPKVPRILITAFPDMGIAIEAVNEEHIENFLPKPLQREVVVQAVASALAQRRAEEQRTHAFAQALESLRQELAARGTRP